MRLLTLSLTVLGGPASVCICAIGTLPLLYIGVSVLLYILITGFALRVRSLARVLLVLLALGSLSFSTVNLRRIRNIWVTVHALSKQLQAGVGICCHRLCRAA